MRDGAKADVPCSTTVYVLFVLLLLFTGAYSYFVWFSSQAVQVFITDSNTNPSVLFNVMVRPYVLWIIAAWASLVINTRWAVRFFKKRSSDGYLSGALIHITWIGTWAMFHFTALFSPFFTQGYVFQ